MARARIEKQPIINFSFSLEITSLQAARIDPDSFKPRFLVEIRLSRRRSKNFAPKPKGIGVKRGNYYRFFID